MLRRKELFVHDDYDDDDNAIFTGGLAHGGNVARSGDLAGRVSGCKRDGRNDDRNGRRRRRFGGRAKSVLDKLFQLPSGDRKRSTGRVSAARG